MMRSGATKSKWQKRSRIGLAIVFSRCFLVGISGEVAQGWEGHKWDEWKQVTTWEKVASDRVQAGRKDLVPLLTPVGGGKENINEITAWEAKRATTAATIRGILGTPTDLKRLGVKAEVLGEEILEDHIRRHIRIRTEADDWIPAYVLLPKELKAGKTAAMICLHQTVEQGKQEPCGMWGNPSLSFALDLVRRGYFCIAPDVIGFGERTPEGAPPYDGSLKFYKKHPNWSFVGKMIWDVGSVIDYLLTMPEVDRLRIGSIGHSHGAYGTLFAAAFEPRISLAIASCGFTTLRSDPSPNRWSHLTALIPQLGTYLPKVEEIPFDWHDICSLIAPRSLFVWYTTKDKIFPNTENLAGVFEDLKGVYGLYGAAGEMGYASAAVPHNFTGEAHRLAYGWLDARFAGTRDLRRIPNTPAAWEAQRVQIIHAMLRDMGELPADSGALDVKVLEEEKLDGLVRRMIEYSVGPGDRVKAYLMMPADANGEQRPGVLVLHQTTAEGKRESVGIAGKATLAFGKELAERGYVTLSPDSICAGERIDGFGAFDTRGHYLRYPALSAMGKMIHDSRRALEVLLQVDGVDGERIGAIGHSLGAEEAAALAAVDPRIKATVASCGWSTFEADEQRIRWARDQWFSYMPMLRPVFLRGDLPAWDWHEVIRLIAPRGYYQHTKSDDPIFPEAVSAHEATLSGRSVWGLYGAEENLVSVLLPGPHEFTDAVRLDAYAWLDGQLKRRGE
jgi:dienelactone hydrolase